MTDDTKPCPHCGESMTLSTTDKDHDGNRLPPAWACGECCHWEWMALDTRDQPMSLSAYEWSIAEN